MTFKHFPVSKKGDFAPTNSDESVRVEDDFSGQANIATKEEQRVRCTKVREAEGTSRLNMDDS